LCEEEIELKPRACQRAPALDEGASGWAGAQHCEFLQAPPLTSRWRVAIRILSLAPGGARLARPLCAAGEVGDTGFEQGASRGRGRIGETSTVRHIAQSSCPLTSVVIGRRAEARRN